MYKTMAPTLILDFTQDAQTSQGVREEAGFGEKEAQIIYEQGPTVPTNNRYMQDLLGWHLSSEQIKRKRNALEALSKAYGNLITAERELKQAEDNYRRSLGPLVCKGDLDGSSQRMPG